MPVWRPDAPRVGNDVLAVRQGCGVTPATRAQAEDAVRVLDAVIARDKAAEAFDNRAFDSEGKWRKVPCTVAESRALQRTAIEAKIHADEQISLYVARYGSTR